MDNLSLNISRLCPKCGYYRIIDGLFIHVDAAADRLLQDSLDPSQISARPPQPDRWNGLLDSSRTAGVVITGSYRHSISFLFGPKHEITWQWDMKVHVPQKPCISHRHHHHRVCVCACCYTSGLPTFFFLEPFFHVDFKEEDFSLAPKLWRENE